MNVRRIWIALFCLAICTVGLADTLKLKDGTVLEGKVIPFGDSYRIKLASGETRTVAKSQVKEYIVGDAKPAAPAAPAPKPDAKPDSKPGAGALAPPTAGSVAGTSSAFAATKSKADRVDAPIQAVQLWDALSSRRRAPISWPPRANWRSGPR